MVRIMAPALCALSALALGACSQQNADFMPGAAPGATRAPAAPSTPAPAALTAVARRASTLIGLPVRSRSGERLGAVADIVFGAHGQATHLIVVHTIAGGAPGWLSPIPWALAIKDLHDGALILKTREFTGAPAFGPDAWPKLDARDWSAAADAYWARVSEPPFIPIDPTTRSRRRPTMNL